MLFVIVIIVLKSTFIGSNCYNYITQIMNKQAFFTLIIAILLVGNCTEISTHTLQFIATYAIQSTFGIQAPYDYNWVQVLPDATTSYIRQTIMDKQGTQNKTQYELGITGLVDPLAIASTNQTCVLMKGESSNFSSYLLDPIAKEITVFNQLPSNLGWQDFNSSNANFKVTQNCRALKVNNDVYHYDSQLQRYVQDQLPFNITPQTVFDDQLIVFISNGSIYSFNQKTRQYELERKDSLSEIVNVVRSDTHPNRVLIYSAKLNAANNRLTFKFSINQFQNGKLVKIKQISDTTEGDSYLVSDRSLSRFVYTIQNSTSNNITIKGVFANYKENKVGQMQIPPQFYTFTSAPYVLFTEKFLYIRQLKQLQSQSDTVRQFIYQLMGTQFSLISQRDIVFGVHQGFKRVVIEDGDTHISLFVQRQPQEFYYKVQEVKIDKLNTRPVIPDEQDPNLFQFVVPAGITLLRSPVNPKWMFFNFIAQSSTTSVTGQIFVMGETGNKVTISDTLVGNWRVLGGTDITLNCALAFNTLAPGAKVFYYNQTSRASQVKADVGPLFVLEGVVNPASVNFDVSDQCQFLKIGNSVYNLDVTGYRNVTVPDGWESPVFDETFKIAVWNGTIYQYYEKNNRYYGVFTPNVPFYLQKAEVYLNNDKLIILTSNRVLSTNPVSYQYRVHCFWSNGSNWNPIDVQLQGSSIIEAPKIQISPDYQSFGISGVGVNGAPFIQGRIINYTNMSLTSRNVKIPSEMIYNNQIPFIRISNNYLYYRRLATAANPIVQNHEAFYQIDKANGLLRYINKRNLTAPEQLVWKNTFVTQVNNSMVVLYESLVQNTVKLTQRIIGNANGGGAPTANIVQSDTGVLMNGNVTYLCPTGCSSCLTSNSCQQCSEGFALLEQSSQCKRCKGSCKTCSATDRNVCTACFPGTYLQTDSCRKCDSSCIQCENQATTCTACKPGMLLNGGDCQSCPLSNCVACQDSSTCLKCRPGFALDSNNECVKCTSSCSACDPTNVLSCLDCRDGFELNSDKKCVKCPQNCKVCVDGVCSECRNDFRITSTGKCAKKCQFPCMSCLDSNPSSCLSCSGEYKLSGRKCVPDSACNSTASCQKCAVGFVLFNGVCVPCQAGSLCKQCDLQDPTICISCLPGYYLDQNSVCIICPSQCKSCQTEQTCTSCKDGFTLSGDSTASQCLTCEFPCVTCSQSTSNCLSCGSGYKLQGWRCKKNTNVGWIFKLNVIFTTVTNTQISNILADIAGLLGIQVSQLTISEAYQGSTVFVGDAPAESSVEVQAGLAALSSVGSTLGGLPILSSSFTGNLDQSQSSQESSNTLAIVLGIVIPIVVVTAIVILIVMYKKSMIAKVVSQSMEPQSHDNLNPMNLKELRLNNEGRQTINSFSAPNEPNYSVINFE